MCVFSPRTSPFPYSLKSRDNVPAVCASQPERFGSIHDFLYKYGGLRTPEQVQQLQTDLQPIMLRRVKEDVEKSIPPKIETIVNVELTNLQVGSCWRS